ncbi:MAG TPA: prepilin-type N-terminal cleavage/methylation domain-containing protein [Luteimonas sp.]|nr:prepilin-type N-terminal cleavage/methylation domain-containing protein [Luteimonas sp.]
MRTMNSRSGKARGFSLIELMVALVVGLIVVGATLALVVAIMKSNRQTLQSTRLNQELRATMAVIVNDLRRSRGTTDPLTEAKLSDGERYNKNIAYSTAGCIRFGYADASGSNAVPPVATPSCHVIMRATTGSDANRVFLNTVPPVTTAFSPGPPAVPKTVTCDTTCPTAGAGTKLGSDQVEITALTFTPTSPCTTTNPCAPLPAVDTVRSFDITVTGRLVDQDAELSSIYRTITQSVQIRSIGKGN